MSDHYIKLEGISSFNDLETLVDDLTPEIGCLGGRFFRCKQSQSSYRLNEIVRCFHKIHTNGQAQKAAGERLLFKIRSLDSLSESKLAKVNVIILIITRIRQQAGNFFYSREAILISMSCFYKQDEPSETKKANTKEETKTDPVKQNLTAKTSDKIRFQLKRSPTIKNLNAIFLEQFNRSLYHPRPSYEEIFLVPLTDIQIPQLPVKLATSSQDPEEVKERIETFVQRFLHPYIAGYITEEGGRTPMMELLMNECSDVHVFSPSEIEAIALDVYTEQAAMGLYVHTRRPPHLGDILPPKPCVPTKYASAEFRYLVEALKEGIPKDFPSKNKIAPIMLNFLAKDGLTRANKKREKAKLEAESYTFFQPDPEMHDAKRAIRLLELEITGKLFF